MRYLVLFCLSSLFCMAQEKVDVLWKARQHPIELNKPAENFLKAPCWVTAVWEQLNKSNFGLNYKQLNQKI